MIANNETATREFSNLKDFENKFSQTDQPFIALVM